MDRREAVQYIALLLGGTVVGSNAFLTGCKTKSSSKTEFTPEDVAYLDEIAETKNMSFAELLTEIENICYSGTKLNLDYYIDEAMDESKQEQLYEYFLNSETDSLEDAINDENNADFSEDDIRLMRVKFLSEYAN